MRDGDVLVVHAALPIAGLEPSRYRPVVLLVGDERFALLAVEGPPGRPTYKLRLETPELYAPSGQPIHYDGERHLERRRERARTALAWVLWIPLVPLMPVLGLLPESWKQKLIHVGINPARATQLSLAIEWLLLTLLLIAYPFAGGLFSLPGLAIGAVAAFVAADIAYRVASDMDNRTPGAFGVGREVVRWIRGVVDVAREPALPPAGPDAAPTPSPNDHAEHTDKPPPPDVRR